MGEEIEMPTVDYRASYLSSQADLKEVRQRAERLESAIREVGGRINLQVGTADDTYVIAVPIGMLRGWGQTLEAALAADRPDEAGGEEPKVDMEKIRQEVRDQQGPPKIGGGFINTRPTPPVKSGEAGGEG